MSLLETRFVNYYFNDVTKDAGIYTNEGGLNDSSWGTRDAPQRHPNDVIFDTYQAYTIAGSQDLSNDEKYTSLMKMMDDFLQ